MNRHLSAGLIIAGLVGAAGMAMPKAAKGQGSSGAHAQAMVVHDVMHAQTGPLRSMPQIPPPKGQKQEVPLRHPKPAQARVKPGTYQDPALQQSSGPLVSTTNGTGFLGVGVGFQGMTSDMYAPPDTNGAAGASQYVQWVNVSFAVFNKLNGDVEEGPISGNTLWQGLGTSSACYANNSGDIIAKYDQVAQKWVMMQPVFTSPYYLCVAVSQTDDATGAWNLYEFPIPGGGFPDYPKLGVWPDGYYVTYNDFGSNGNSFQGGYACALDRASMIAGAGATMQCFNSGDPSLLPSDLDGDSGASGSTSAPPAGSPDYFIDFSGTNSLNLWKFHVDWTTPSNSTFTGPAVIPVDAFSEACGGGTCIPQPGTHEQLDSLGDRLMYRFAYRNFGSYESLVVSQSVDTGSGNTGVRWYEIRSPESNPTVYQQGTYAPDSNYRWMPSIAEDENGDIALGYSVSSKGIYPSIRYTGRLASDPINTMESEATILTGSGSQLSNLNRWGDYSSMSVDPGDDCTFWYTTEYLQNSGTFNWSTQIASFKFPGCGTATVPAAPTGLTATAGNNQVSLTWNSSSGATSYDLYRSTTSGSFSSTATASGITSTSYTDTTAANGTTYYYVVTAVNSAGASGYSTQVSATPQAATTPAAPTNLSAKSNKSGHINLNWTQSTSPNITYNKIYRGASGTTPTFYIQLSATTSYNDTNTSKKTSYCYYVTAVNSSGLESSPSNTACATAGLGAK